MTRSSRKDYKPATFRLSPDMIKRLDEYSQSTGITKTFVVEKALREYFSKKDAVNKPQAMKQNDN